MSTYEQGKSKIKSKIQNVVGSTQLQSDITDIRNMVRKLAGDDGSNLEILEGTPYSRYLMPLEYMPSRDLTPRWGYGKPTLKSVEDIFATKDSSYINVLREMRQLAPYFEKIPKTFDLKTLPNPGWAGIPISPIDVALLYYFITHYKPKTYLEIGSGATTCFARRAIEDHHLSTKIISIDPEPRAQIESICDQVFYKGLETIDLSIFSKLEAGDIVFMDGSHRTFMNSDVTVFMLEVVPYLKPGVIVHIHDILLPHDYPASFTSWYWSEQYMVAMYLIAAKERITPIFPSAYVTMDKKFDSELNIPLFQSIWGNCGGGGSLWFTHS